MKNNSKMLELLLSGKIDDLEKALKENIQEENNKKAGTKKEATIIKKFLKHVKNRKDLNGAFKIDGSFYFCNMYSVLKSCNDYGFEHVEGFKNAKNMFSQKFDKKITVDIADIKTFLAIEKAASKAEKRTMSPYIIKINGGFLGVNPDYLLDILQFVGVDHFYIDEKSVKNGCYIAPIQAYSNDGKKEAILLPINIGADNVKYDVDASDNEERQEVENDIVKKYINEYKEEFENLKKFFEDGNSSTLDACEKYVCFIDIMDDIECYTDTGGFVYLNHINYKLRNYGFSYAGKWSYIKNGFDYTDTSNKERRILRRAKCAIYNFIDELRGVA